MTTPRFTPAVSRVMRFLVASERRESYGFQISSATRVRPHAVYAILNRFRDAGWLTDRHETVNTEHKGRPARVFFVLTELGEAEARAGIAEFDARAAEPDPVPREGRFTRRGRRRP